MNSLRERYFVSTAVAVFKKLANQLITPRSRYVLFMMGRRVPMINLSLTEHSTNTDQVEARWTIEKCRYRSASKSLYYIFVVLLFHQMYCPRGGIIEACRTSEYESLIRYRKQFNLPEVGSGIVGSDCCEWYGVTCNNDKKSVISLDLGNFSSDDEDQGGTSTNRLEHLCNLENLQKLNLRFNGLSGALPECFGNLTALTILYLSFNNLTGGLPSSMSSLSNLISVDLSNNTLDGDISRWFNLGSSLQNLTSETREVGAHRSMKKPIVDDIPWKKLKVLKLNSNRISGHIPSWLENLPELISIDLSDNKLSGKVPSFENCSRLKKVMLGGNQFEGMVLNSFCSKRRIRTLSLNNNKLTGPLPDLRNCQNLTLLDVTSNQLTGTIPSWLENLGNTLQFLLLGSNRFFGHFPAWLGSFQHLRILDLSNNNISGGIPPTVNLLQGNKKASWEADTNMLWPFGGLSLMLGKFDPRSSVLFRTRFSLSSYVETLQYYPTYNGFNWTIFNSDAIRYVTRFDISRNAFEGTIPSQFGDLDGLVFLNLSSNFFSGSIPSDLGHMESIYSLEVSFNKLTGTIPRELTFNGYMFHFNVSYNNLWGPIPQEYRFHMFDRFSYLGNRGLCDAPLDHCPIQSRVPVESAATDKSETWVEFTSLFVGFAGGFVGTWSFILACRRTRDFAFGEDY